MGKKRYTVKGLDTWVELEEYRRRCVDVEKFLAYCKQCPNYGRVWSCPRYDFDPRTVWDRYTKLHLYARVLTPLPGAEIEEMMAGLREEKDRLFEFLLEREKERPGALALSAGCCTLCEGCARLEGRPCVKPELMRWSIESLGGDVAATMERYFGHPILWIQEGKLPAYLTLVGGVLER